jgi:hypothetical protein
MGDKGENKSMCRERHGWKDSEMGDKEKVLEKYTRGTEVVTKDIEEY